MHNCKDSKEAVIEAALQGWIPGPDEFAGCSQCLQEFHSLRRTTQMTGDGLQLVQPPENYWVRYDARLRRRLAQNEQPMRTSRPITFASLLRAVLTSSVPVPAPLALAIFGFIAFSIFFLLRSTTTSSVTPAPTPSTVVTRTIEVPVIREKQVTRVVYRDRRTAQQPGPATLARDSVVAAKRREPVESLEGFTPAHEPKLTLIKGSRDEK